MKNLQIKLEEFFNNSAYKNRFKSVYFSPVSKKAWLDCLFQLLKISIMNRITP